MPLHSTGIYNGQTELYIIYENSVEIYNGATLEKITSFEVSGVNSLTSIRAENNLLFIGAWDVDNNNLFVYSRETLTQVSQGNYTINARILSTYTGSNNIYCVSFPQYSSESYFLVDVFDNAGNFISGNMLNYFSDNDLIRTNNSSAFVLNGEEGHIYYKSDFSVYLSNTVDYKISSTGNLTDYRISSDGNTVYTIQDDYTVRLYNALDFSIYETIEINEKGRHLFLDEQKILIIDYLEFSNENTKVYLSEYLK